jgi:hypothetical protein
VFAHGGSSTDQKMPGVTRNTLPHQHYRVQPSQDWSSPCVFGLDELKGNTSSGG